MLKCTSPRDAVSDIKISAPEQTIIIPRFSLYFIPKQLRKNGGGRGVKIWAVPKLASSSERGLKSISVVVFVFAASCEKKIQKEEGRAIKLGWLHLWQLSDPEEFERADVAFGGGGKRGERRAKWPDLVLNRLAFSRCPKSD